MSIERLGKKSPRSPEQIDYGWVKAFLSKEIARFVGAIRVPKDGEPGKDADPEAITRAVHEAVAAVPLPTVKDGDPGPRGPKGPKGDDGEMGPMPAHRWEGTELQFERPDGSWGKRVDLLGPRGYPGSSGGVLVQGSGDFDLDSLGLADPNITPEQVIVKQNGVWLRMGWDDFVILVGAPPPTGQRYADDYADGYTVYE